MRNRFWIVIVALLLAVSRQTLADQEVEEFTPADCEHRLESLLEDLSSN